jgi:tetratricopeptide (TPR) repeat protein
MRFLAGAILALAACTTPSPGEGPGPGLPDLGEPDEPLVDSEKGAGSAALGLAEERLAGSDQGDHHVIAILRFHWPAMRDSARANLLLAEAHARYVDTLDLKKDALHHERHRNAGRFHAERALRLDPESGAARYWLGVLLLFAADGEQSYARLKEALKALDAAERSVPGVDDGGPARMKGRIYQETPGFPFLGSKDKAIECFKRSLEIAPGRLRTRLWIAEAYVGEHKAAAARAELGSILAAPRNERRPREDGEVRLEAKALLLKLPAE